MRVLAGVAAAVLAVVVTGGAVQAQTSQEPAEIPPAGYSGNQYIDSKGCVFLRAEFAGKTSWVARLGRDRKPVCGYDPTAVATTAPEAAPVAAAPESAATPVATKEPKPAAKTPVAAKPAKAKATRKPAPVAAEPDTLALVATRRVGGNATYCPGAANAAQRYLLSDGKRVTRCASDNGEAVAFINSLDVPGVVVSSRAPTAGEVRRATKADQGGYRVTWVRGDLSPEGEAAFAEAARGGVIISDGVPTAPVAVAAPVASGAGSFVQIGAFADPANAERALQTLGRLGLPASVGVGGRLKVVLAGPFGSAAELSNAMALLRQNGYRDAFPTRG